MKGQDFQWMPFSDDLLPNVEVIGRYNRSRGRFSLRAHLHGPERFEITYVAGGRQTYKINERPYSMSGGDVLVIYPNDTHAIGGDTEERCLLYYVVLNLPRSGDAILGLKGPHAIRLREALLAIRPRHFAGSPALRACFEEFVRVYPVLAADPLAVVRIRSLILRLLLEIIDCARRQARRHISSPIAEAVRLIEKNIDAAPRIEQLARRCRLSPSRFKARFKEEIAIPPADFIRRSRVEQARQTLTRHPDRSITRIALDLGFSSSQQFCVVFRRYTGRSPSHYRRDAPRPI